MAIRFLAFVGFLLVDDDDVFVLAWQDREWHKTDDDWKDASELVAVENLVVVSVVSGLVAVAAKVVLEEKVDF